MRTRPTKSFILLSWIILAAFVTSTLHAQIGGESLTPNGRARKQCITQRVESGVIRMDGIIDEAEWNKVDWSGDFIQYQPDEGASPYQQTQFKILHDDKYLYFAGRAYDIRPDSIIERLGRRDEFPGDWIEGKY
jgi:hypothetical protein